MKKPIVLTVLAMFIISILPAAIAEENSSDSSGSSSTTETSVDTETETEVETETSDGKTRVRERVKERIESGKERIETRLETRTERITTRADTMRNKSVDIRAHQSERLTLAYDKCKESDKDPATCEAMLAKREALVAKLSANDLARIDKIETARLAHARDEAKIRAKVQHRIVVKAKIEAAEKRVKDAREHFAKVNVEFKQRKDKLKGKADELRACKGKDTDVCVALRAEANADAIVFLGNTADMMLAELNRIKARIEANEELSDERAAKLIANIDARITAVTDVKAEIDALGDDSTTDELKDVAKELRAAWKDAKNDLERAAKHIVSGRIGGILIKEKHLQRVLDRTLQHATEEGKDVSVVNGKVDAFNAELASAIIHYDAAVAALNAGNTQQGHTELQAAHTDLREAHALFVEISKALRTQEVTIEMDTEAEEELELEDESIADESTSASATATSTADTSSSVATDTSVQTSADTTASTSAETTTTTTTDSSGTTDASTSTSASVEVSATLG